MIKNLKVKSQKFPPKADPPLAEKLQVKIKNFGF